MVRTAIHTDMRQTPLQLFIARRTVLKTSLHTKTPKLLSAVLHCSRFNAATQQIRTASDRVWTSSDRSAPGYPQGWSAVLGVTTAQQPDTWLTEDAERMTELPICISGAQFDDWATSKNNRRSCAAQGSREAGFRTIRSGQPFAFAERLRRSANDPGSTPLADRRRLRGCGMFTSTEA
jgi:hypothetical protein